MLPDNPDRRGDYWEHGLEFGPMSAACLERGVELREVVWDDPGVDPGAFEAMVIGTTWDYPQRPEAFLERLGAFAAATTLLNPLDVVRWNLDKRYLEELAERGAPTVPTLWRAGADEPTLRAALDELGVDELVVKPVVGAAAWRQAIVARGRPTPPADQLPPAEAMIQPFLPSVVSEGEYSFIFFDGEFSHCARKVPAEGDYRVQAIYGARERVHHPSADELAAARGVLQAAPGRLLYARVDMLRGLDGRLAVIEVELIEPYLYPEQGPQMGEKFAQALVRLLGARPA